MRTAAEEAGDADRRTRRPHQYLRPDLLAPDDHCVLLMVAEQAVDQLHDMLAGWPGKVAWQLFQDELPPNRNSRSSSTAGITRPCRR